MEKSTAQADTVDANHQHHRHWSNTKKDEESKSDEKSQNSKRGGED